MEKKYLNVGQKIAYGCGDMGSNFMYEMVNSFILLYLTNAVGLNPAVVGTLMMAAKVFDGVTDLFFGALIDRTKSRLGKARPWMLWSVVPLAVCEVLLFSIPNIGQTLQYAYFFVLYCLLNAVCYTINNIAYSAMLALITRNGNERVQLGSFRFIMALLSGLFISTYTVSFVEHFGNNMAAWRIVALLYAVVLVVLELICIAFCRELPEEERKEAADSPKKGSAFHDLKLLVSNKYYVRVLGYNLVRYFGSGIAGGVIVYFALYVLGNAQLLGALAAASRAPSIICLVLTPILVKKFDVYKVNLVGRAVGLICAIGTMIAGYMDSLSGIVVIAVFSSLLSSPMTGTINAVVADVAHYTWLKDNRHVEGAMFSCTSIGVKVGSGLGTAVCGWLLAIGGFDGMAQTQTSGALSMISFMYLVIPIFLQIIMFVIAAGLNVQKANRELENKNETAEE